LFLESHHVLSCKNIITSETQVLHKGLDIFCKFTDNQTASDKNQRVTDLLTAADEYGSRPSYVAHRNCCGPTGRQADHSAYTARLSPSDDSQHARDNITAFFYINCVTARHSGSGVSQTLRRGTRNGITELLQRAPHKVRFSTPTRT